MRVTVRFFAGCRDATKTDTTIIELPAESALPDLKRILGRTYPSLARYLDRIRYSVNWEYVGSNATLRDGDEVALIPPVAGGALENFDG
jgi:molybdopterin synthase catalytic subunit